ncbi:MAG: hypothetical protein B7733_23365 [Myxococcales bacterium FL481]|nr:MAG: hypothetical protein B7733_23365 [Myxococcales bacterium FL481]
MAVSMGLGWGESGSLRSFGRAQGRARLRLILVSGRTTDHLLGSVVAGRYSLTEVIGNGAMGKVYRARHVLLHNDVAIKIMHPHLLGHESYRERFLREAQAAAGVEHDNVLSVSDFGELDGGSAFFTMELLRGEDLSHLLEREGRLGWEPARGLLLQLVRGLAAVHDAGVVHRDIKPANCFLVDDGERVKIIDFGLAKFEWPSAGATEHPTLQGAVMGTPYYMSPEQALGRPVDGRTDIYAVGVLLFRMLTGRVPFVGSADEVRRQHIQATVPAPSEVAGVRLPRAVERLMFSAMAKDAAERFGSMAAFERAILAAWDPREEAAEELRGDPWGSWERGFRAAPNQPIVPFPAPASGSDPPSIEGDGRRGAFSEVPLTRSASGPETPTTEAVTYGGFADVPLAGPASGPETLTPEVADNGEFPDVPLTELASGPEPTMTEAARYGGFSDVPSPKHASGPVAETAMMNPDSYGGFADVPIITSSSGQVAPTQVVEAEPGSSFSEVSIAVRSPSRVAATQVMDATTSGAVAEERAPVRAPGRVAATQFIEADGDSMGALPVLHASDTTSVVPPGRSRRVLSVLALGGVAAAAVAWWFAGRTPAPVQTAPALASSHAATGRARAATELGGPPVAPAAEGPRDTPPRHEVDPTLSVAVGRDALAAHAVAGAGLGATRSVADPSESGPASDHVEQASSDAAPDEAGSGRQRRRRPKRKLERALIERLVVGVQPHLSACSEHAGGKRPLVRVAFTIPRGGGPARDAKVVGMAKSNPLAECVVRTVESKLRFPASRAKQEFEARVRIR